MHTPTTPIAANALPAETSQPFTRTLPGKAVLAVTASLFVALCAHIAVPLPFTPVPLTLSDFAVLLIGLTLAPEVAFAALVLYLAEGLSGAPVFTTATFPTLAARFAVTGGFLAAYPFAAGLIAVIKRSLPRTFLSSLTAATAGSALIMTSGILWLALSLPFASAFAKAGAPFLLGQLLKIACAATIVTAATKLRKA